MTKLRNKFSPFFWIVVLQLCALSTFAQTRGVKVRVNDDKGQAEIISLYKGSYALVIGNSAYINGWRKLPGVLEDMTEIETTLQKKGFEIVTAQDLSRSEFRKVVEQFINKYGLNPENQLVIYFAGHGYTERIGRQDIGYIVMTDAPLPDKDIAVFRQSAVEMTEIESMAKRIKAKHALFVFDSCFSGFLTRNQGPKLPEFISKSIMQPVRQFITSGSADQEVPDKSIFRVMFQRGLQGEADYNNDKYVTGMELGFFLQQKVVDYTNNTQTPQYSKIRDIALDLGDSVFLVENIKSEASEKQTICAPHFPLNADTLNDENKARQAIEDLNKTIRQNPECSEAYISRGTLLSKKGKKEEALKDFTKIIELDPKGFAGYGMRGVSHLRDFGDNLKAHQDLTTAIDNVSEKYKNCEKEGNCSEFFAVMQPLVYMNGEALLNLKKYDLAINELNTAISICIKLNMDDYRPFYLRGLAHFYTATDVSKKKDTPVTTKHLQDAMQDFTKAIALSPSNPYPHFQRGSVYGTLAIITNDKEAMSKGIRDVSKSIELDPSYVPAYQIRADFYEATGDTRKANADRLRVDELQNPKQDLGPLSSSTSPEGNGVRPCTNSLRYYPLTQEILEDSNKLGIALADYDRFISSNPECMRAYIGRGSIFAKQGETIKAILDFTKAIQLEPDAYMGYSMRGMAYFTLQGYEKTVNDLGAALTRCKQDENCRKSVIINQITAGRGQALAHLGRWEEAIVDLNEAVKVYNTNPEIYFLRGRSYFERICVPKCTIEGFQAERGKESLLAAIKDYDKAISLNPHNPNYYLGRGVAFASRGYGENSRDLIVRGINDLTKSIEMDPNSYGLYDLRSMYFTAIGETEKGNADKRKAEQLKRENKD